MNRFHISRLVVTGNGKPDSVLEFRPGVNIVYGPSNTGKSLVLKSLNYMLAGQDAPFDSEIMGYDTITMTMEIDSGAILIAERKIRGTKCESSVDIICDDINIQSKKYNNKEYNKLLLSLLDIHDEIKVFRKLDFSTSSLTFRSFMHLFYLNENDMIESASSFYKRKHSSTLDLTSLLFLLTGDDLQRLLPNTSSAELREKAIANAGVLAYLKTKLAKLDERKVEVSTIISNMTDISVEKKIEYIFHDLIEINEKISATKSEKKYIVAQMYDLVQELEEAEMLKKRYAMLRTQYASDINRLEFIKDSEEKIQNTHSAYCPFCDSPICTTDRDTITFREAAQAEQKKIKQQMIELSEIENYNQSKIKLLSENIDKLSKRDGELISLISTLLTPQAEELRTSFELYKQALSDRQELYALEAMSQDLNLDARDRENAKELKNSQLDIRAQFTDEVWHSLSNSFSAMLKECAYPGNPDSYISKDTFDAVVGGRHKNQEGKGYCAFLNTIMLFNLLVHLEHHGRYSLRILLLDTPVQSLKEVEYDVGLRMTQGMKKSLFSCMIQHCGDNQVFIAENNIPDGVDYSSVNLIEFTKCAEGRYGFLDQLGNSGALRPQES